MEQVIFLIVIYTIWGIAQAISKSKKKQGSKAKPRQPKRQPPVPPEWQPKRGEARPSKDPELPEFLRGLLEMAEQAGETPEPPVPTPVPQPPVVQIETPQEDDFEYADDGTEGVRHTSFDKLNDAYDKPQLDRLRGDWKTQLRSPGRVRDAFILKEVLDKPVSLRRRGFPFGSL